MVILLLYLTVGGLRYLINKLSESKVKALREGKVYFYTVGLSSEQLQEGLNKINQLSGKVGVSVLYGAPTYDSVQVVSRKDYAGYCTHKDYITVESNPRNYLMSTEVLYKELMEFNPTEGVKGGSEGLYDMWWQ